MTPILECAGVFKNFGGVPAVAGVDLQVQEGHIHSVIGPTAEVDDDAGCVSSWGYSG